MKIDFPVTSPQGVRPGWEGQFQVFSWYNFVLNVPTPLYIVTTLKKNGLPNAQLTAWGMLLGSGLEPKFMLQLMNTSDTLSLIERTGEFVVNFPSYELKERLLRCTVHYPEGVDELSASGLTPEESSLVSAPRVKECYGHFECTLDWSRPLETKNPMNTLVVGNIVGASIDEEYLLKDSKNSLKKRGIPYHVGEFYNHLERRCSEGSESGFCLLDADNIKFAKE